MSIKNRGLEIETKNSGQRKMEGDRDDGEKS